MTEQLPNVTFGCNGDARPSYPPCRSVWVRGWGSRLSSHSFQVSLDEHGVVTGVSSPAYDAW